MINLYSQSASHSYSSSHSSVCARSRPRALARHRLELSPAVIARLFEVRVLHCMRSSFCGARSHRVTLAKVCQCSTGHVCVCPEAGSSTLYRRACQVPCLKAAVTVRGTRWRSAMLFPRDLVVHVMLRAKEDEVKGRRHPAFVAPRSFGIASSFKYTATRRVFYEGAEYFFSYSSKMAADEFTLSRVTSRLCTNNSLTSLDTGFKVFS